MAFKILTLEDREEWSEVIASLPSDQQDLHFLPEYGEIYAGVYQFRPFLAVYDTGSQGLVAQAFVERPLRDLPFLRAGSKRNTQTEFYDISSPYGYGGPVFRGSDRLTLLGNFEQHFLKEAASRGWASEFTSVHPLIENQKWLIAVGVENVVPQKSVAFIDLTASEDALWAGLDKGHKSSVKKARRLGLQVRKVPFGIPELETYHALYLQTMRRRSAADRWHFEDLFFRETAKKLGDQGASLFFAFHDNVPIAGYFLIHGFSTAYLHFSGADEKFLQMSPNNLLMYETALWAKGAGYKTYHLGGGVTSAPDDSLLSFKSGFGARKAELSTYYRILNRANYDLLCELKADYELETSARVQNPDFFPMYRR